LRQGVSRNPDRAGETASGRQRKSPSNTAIQIQGAYDDDWLAGRVVAITQLAAELDRQTLQLALVSSPSNGGQRASATPTWTVFLLPVSACAIQSSTLPRRDRTC
jgi:hypothetical protein